MKIIDFILLTAILLHLPLLPVSFVYNLRIAETTRRQATEAKFRRPSIIAGALIDQMRTRYDGAKQNIFGGLVVLVYSRKNSYFRVDFAVGQVKERLNKVRFSRQQTDDIICYAGHTHQFTDRFKMTGSLLFGVPTHRDTIFEGIEFGTGHVGLGVQADSGYVYSQNRHHSVLAAARYVHFFPRCVCIPLLSRTRSFKFNIGNIVDLLISHYSAWGHNTFEVGYNAGFNFGATLQPSIANIINNFSGIRHNFYANYKYRFLLKKFPSAWSFGTSYGFDSKPKTVGIKRSVTLWAGWGINF